MQSLLILSRDKPTQAPGLIWCFLIPFALFALAYNLATIALSAFGFAMAVVSIIEAHGHFNGCEYPMAVWFTAFAAVNWPFFILLLCMDKKSTAFINVRRIYATGMTSLCISGLVLVTTKDYEACNAKMYYWFYIAAFILPIAYYSIVAGYIVILCGICLLRTNPEVDEKLKNQEPPSALSLI